MGLGDGLLEQLQLFGDDFQAGAAGHPCDVPARPREARDEPGANGIANANHDDGDRLGGILGCRHSLRPRRYDDVHLEPDQLGRKIGQPVEPTLRKSIVDDNILALNPPELAQPCHKTLRVVADSLYRVIHYCVTNDLPILTVLVVRSNNRKLSGDAVKNIYNECRDLGVDVGLDPDAFVQTQIELSHNVVIDQLPEAK